MYIDLNSNKILFKNVNAFKPPMVKLNKITNKIISKLKKEYNFEWNIRDWCGNVDKQEVWVEFENDLPENIADDIFDFVEKL